MTPDGVFTHGFHEGLRSSKERYGIQENDIGRKLGLTFASLQDWPISLRSHYSSQEITKKTLELV